MKSHLLSFVLVASAVILATAQASEPSQSQPAKLPSLAGPFANQTLPVNSGAVIVGDLDQYFTGKDLTYSISLTGDAVTTFSFDASNVLSLAPMGSPGTAIMTITATDKARSSIQASFTITVAAFPDAGYSLTQTE